MYFVVASDSEIALFQSTLNGLSVPISGWCLKKKRFGVPVKRNVTASTRLLPAGAPAGAAAGARVETPPSTFWSSGPSSGSRQRALYPVVVCDPTCSKVSTRYSLTPGGA